VRHRRPTTAANAAQCDEVRPVCGNCKRRFTEVESCEYRDHSSEDSSDSLTSRRPQPLRPAGTENHMLELQLIYHYATSAWQELPVCHGGLEDDMWQKTIPRVGFQSRLVLEPMLAVSALHLLSRDPQDKQMALAMSQYLDRTLSKSIEALTAAQQFTEPLFLAAVSIVTIAWILAHREVPGERYQMPLGPFLMIRGMSSLVLKNASQLVALGYEQFTVEMVEPLRSAEILPESSRRQLLGVQDDLDKLLHGFNVQGMPEQRRLVYQDAATFVLRQYLAYFLGAPDRYLQRFVPTMPVRSHPDFLPLLEVEDPLAMALWARTCVLLKYIAQVWWLQGWGEYNVVHRDVRGIASLMPDEHIWSMEWPLKVLDGEIIFDRGPTADPGSKWEGDGHECLAFWRWCPVCREISWEKAFRLPEDVPTRRLWK
jgi:hypothetical protein